MKFLIFFFLILLINNNSYASIKSKILNNLKKTNNISFEFKQKINKKEETGKCIIKYPKKIYCAYEDKYNKILVSDGNSLVIKSEKNRQYYRYSLKSTSLNILLNKKLLIKHIEEIEGKLINNKYYVFYLNTENNSIKIFFEKDTFNLIGWQTEDIYQNLSITFIYNLEINKNVNENLFDLPEMH
tara:strand:- start:61 stop:615 length:555 start_codon:yes stop_codon:yes gene_type:complete